MVSDPPPRDGVLPRVKSVPRVEYGHVLGPRLIIEAEAPPAPPTSSGGPPRNKIPWPDPWPNAPLSISPLHRVLGGMPITARQMRWAAWFAALWFLMDLSQWATDWAAPRVVWLWGMV